MFFAVTKFTFDIDTETSFDVKDLKSLTEKVRARFKVCARPCRENDDSGDVSFAVAALADTEEKLARTLDDIAAFCEESGFGRIEFEKTLMDHIDGIEDQEEVDSEN